MDFCMHFEQAREERLTKGPGKSIINLTFLLVLLL